MIHRIASLLPTSMPKRQPGAQQPPQPLRDVLVELLAAYQTRFPELRITLVETSAAPTA
jgi:hypothetical protein